MDRYYFKKRDRILHRPEFLQLSKFGKKILNEYFIILYRTGIHDRTRIGITVTKKVGGAVVRNRLKRRVREYFRLNKHNIKGNLDLNLIAKKQSANLPSDLFFKNLHQIFDKLAGSFND